MKDSTLALLAIAGGGYLILKQGQKTAEAVQGVAEIPLIPFKAAGNIFHGAEEQLIAGRDFVGQTAAKILSNTGQVIAVSQKQLEQVPNNVLTALPAAAINAFAITNPLTLPIAAAAGTTTSAIQNLLNPTQVSTPTAPMTSTKPTTNTNTFGVSYSTSAGSFTSSSTLSQAVKQTNLLTGQSISPNFKASVTSSTGAVKQFTTTAAANDYALATGGKLQYAKGV